MSVREALPLMYEGTMARARKHGFVDYVDSERDFMRGSAWSSVEYAGKNYPGKVREDSMRDILWALIYGSHAKP